MSRPQPRCVIRVLQSSFGTDAKSFLQTLPSSVCEFWHPSVSPAESQRLEIYSDAKDCNRGVYCIDCGYDDDTATASTDPLSWYVYGGNAPGLLDAGKATAANGLVPDLIDKMCEAGGVANVAFFAINSAAKNVVDLMAPFTMIGPTGTLSYLTVTNSGAFMEVFTQISASLTFRSQRSKVSFGFLIRNNNALHVVLILKEKHHQKFLRILVDEVGEELNELKSMATVDLLRHIRSLMQPPPGVVDGPFLIARVMETCGTDTLGIGVLAVECTREGGAAANGGELFGQASQPALVETPRQSREVAAMLHDVQEREREAPPTDRSAATPFINTPYTMSDTLSYLLNDKEVCLNLHREMLKDTDAALATLAELKDTHKKHRARREQHKAELDSVYGVCTAADERLQQMKSLMTVASRELEEVQHETSRIKQVVDGCGTEETGRRELELMKIKHDEQIRHAQTSADADIRNLTAEEARALEAEQAEVAVIEQRAMATAHNLKTNVQHANDALIAFRNEEAELTTEDEVLGKTISELKNIEGVAKEAVATASTNAQNTKGEVARLENLETDADRVSRETMTAGMVLENKQAKALSLQRELDSYSKKSKYIRERISANNTKLSVAHRSMISLHESARRKQISTEYQREFNKMFRSWLSAAPSRPIVGYEMVIDKVNTDLATLARRREPIAQERVELNESLSLLQAELEVALQSQEKDIAALDHDASLRMERVMQLRAQRDHRQLGHRKELQVVKDTYKSIHTEFLAAIHDETYPAVGLIRNMEAGRSPDPKDPLNKTPAKPMIEHPQFVTATEDDVCRLFMAWVDASSRTNQQKSESEALRRKVSELQATADSSATTLQNDRELLGELEGQLNEVMGNVGEATEALDNFVQQQRDHRAAMENAIVDSHREGQLQLETASHDVAAATVVLEHLEEQVKDAQREANRIAAEMEVAEHGSCGMLRQDLERTSEENEALENELQQLKLRNAQSRSSTSVPSVRPKSPAASRLFSPASPWEAASVEYEAANVLVSTPPPSTTARDAARDKLQQMLQTKRDNV